MMRMLLNEFNVIAEVIKSKTIKKPIYYLANPGNWGDALIRQGTLKFFSDINLEYTEVSRNIFNWLRPLYSGGTVIYGGGGGWCEIWNQPQKYLTALTKRFDVIVLPSTFGKKYEISNTIFFCRDSFDSANHMPDAKFCHDMAFYLGNQFCTEEKGRGKGYFYRTDLESANQINVPLTNNDISLQGNHFSEVSQFFAQLDQFASIYTDRLHVAIAACLLQKEVHLYPGSYFKNKAIYDSSIKNNFKNTYFHNSLDN